LKEELESLIDLIKQSIAPTPSSAPPPPAPVPSTSKSASTSTTTTSTSESKPKKVWKSGDDCSARYTGDGKWYPAKITSVAGSTEAPIYTVIFKGYDTPETVTQKDLRPASNQFGNGAAPANAGPPLGGGDAGGGKRKAGEPSQAELDKEKKKKKNEKKAETQKAKAEEQANRQKGWQSFAKKSAKKGVHIPGMTGESMFRSPADMVPQAKG